MRTDISIDKFGWLYRLDYKKLIIIVFLLRLIAASAYDVLVTLTDKDFILPDSKFYSMKGRCVDFMLEGYDRRAFPKDLLPNNKADMDIFSETMWCGKDSLPPLNNESSVHVRIIGLLYFIFGRSTIWARIFNICINILSVYLLFRVAKRYFGDLAANLFLIIALFLPTQFMYSITLSRDFLRVFIVSAIIWVAYTKGDIWVKKLKSQF